MKAIRYPASLFAVSALAFTLVACGPSEVVRTVEVERPASTVFARLATTPAGTAFGAGALTVTNAANDIVRGDLKIGDDTVPVEFSMAASGAGVTLSAKASKARAGGEKMDEVLDAGLAAFNTDIAQVGAFDFGDLKFDVVDVPGRNFLYIEAGTPNDAASIKSGVLQAMSIVDAQIKANGLIPDGDPIAVETKWDEAAGRYEFQAGRPFRGTPPVLLIAVKVGQTPGGTAIKVNYEGPEANVIPVYDQIETLIDATRLEKATGSFEVYKDDPTQAGGSVKREIWHVVSGDAQRLLTLFPNSRPTPMALPAPAPVVAPEQPAVAPAPAVVETPAPTAAPPPAASEQPQPVTP